MPTGERGRDLCSTADQIRLSDVQRVTCTQRAQPSGLAEQLRHESSSLARRGNTQFALQQGGQPMVDADCTCSISRIDVQLDQRPMS
jgi:hypothetical protein